MSFIDVVSPVVIGDICVSVYPQPSEQQMDGSRYDGKVEETIWRKFSHGRKIRLNHKD